MSFGRHETSPPEPSPPSQDSLLTVMRTVDGLVRADPSPFDPYLQAVDRHYDYDASCRVAPEDPEESVRQKLDGLHDNSYDEASFALGTPHGRQLLGVIARLTPYGQASDPSNRLYSVMIEVEQDKPETAELARHYYLDRGPVGISVSRQDRNYISAAMDAALDDSYNPDSAWGKEMQKQQTGALAREEGAFAADTAAGKLKASQAEIDKLQTLLDSGQLLPHASGYDAEVSRKALERAMSEEAKNRLDELFDTEEHRPRAYGEPHIRVGAYTGTMVRAELHAYGRLATTMSQDVAGEAPTHAIIAEDIDSAFAEVLAELREEYEEGERESAASRAVRTQQELQRQEPGQQEVLEVPRRLGRLALLIQRLTRR